MKGFQILGLFCLLGTSTSVEESKRQARFSLFNVVQFDNEVCKSTSGITRGGRTRDGTCYTKSECEEKGGAVAGSCASGFGVCCVFSLQNGGSSSQNNTYLRNPNFPNALVNVERTAVSYTVEKCSCDVCFLRLDFLSFTLEGVANTEELEGGICVDTFTATGSAQSNVPVICGQNSGQHIYIDMGNECSDNAKLAFAFSGASTIRVWEIQATQIKCGAPEAPPYGCLQYHTEISGRFTSFNFQPVDENHLQGQEYSICIRQHPGFCCVQYQVCPDSLDNGFTLDPPGAPATIDVAYVDSDCTKDHVIISASGGICSNPTSGGNVHSRYCGNKFNANSGSTTHGPVCDCTGPFDVRIFTDLVSDNADPAIANTSPSRGVCLEYVQIPCGGA